MAIVGHLILIPRWGSIGAAIVATTVASGGAIASVLTIYRLWGILPPWRSLLRAIVMCGCAYGLSSISLPPHWVLLKLLAISTVILLGLLLSGEFTPQERTQFRTAIRDRLPSR
ncbi:hypothetical protein [Chamaesiphon minutus]|uniref:hypothetical protein n=1 Tax=Chamaesiphon minutus TaxID=1173032 RepID=UPI0002EB3092|nr:hypothetical protein [Chamaesiphon minutus]